ncbi:MAG: TetR/AcrR family transcriptional regulator, partial [Bacteroides graminisolvens]|nr:TetR/AcrR family transcriptional regulator [Bacteroides graminisolvens]
PLLRIKDQLLDEMDKGILQKMPLVDVVSTLVSLLVFPMLTKNMLTILFLEGNSQAFAEFYERRRVLVVKVMRNLLTP